MTSMYGCENQRVHSSGFHCKGKPVIASSIAPEVAAGLPGNIAVRAQAAYEALQAMARR